MKLAVLILVAVSCQAQTPISTEQFKTLLAPLNLLIQKLQLSRGQGVPLPASYAQQLLTMFTQVSNAYQTAVAQQSCVMAGVPESFRVQLQKVPEMASQGYIPTVIGYVPQMTPVPFPAN